MKKIIYTRPDGGISVIHPAPGIDLQTVLQKDIPTDATNVQILDETEIPQDRLFRNAWRCPDKQIVHDMNECRTLYRQKLQDQKKSTNDPRINQAQTPEELKQLNLLDKN